ncbi:MAG: TonB family protein [Halomonas sp.]|nr:TonB family protein [Halomonas sp.]
MNASLGTGLRHVPVSRPRRHWAAWTGAVLLHALAVVLVADWQMGERSSPPPKTSIDVVLATQPAVDPSVAQAIAEASQQAIRRESADPTPTPENSSTPAKTSPPASPSPEPRPQQPAARTEAPPQPAPASRPVSPATPAEPASPPVDTPPSSGQALLAQATASIRERGFEAAPDTDQLGNDNQQAARRAAEARYIDDWTRRVETYGNRFYPAPSDLDGQLRIRVVVGRDGQVRQAEVIHSSGHPELDRAALQTIHGAAPYRPFDSGLAGRDSLTITRVWRFGKGNNFGVR